MGKPTLTAKGDVPTGGWQEKLIVSPEMIDPSRYEAQCLKPTGVVDQMIHHYEKTLTLPPKTKDGDVIQVYDSSGIHSVTYVSNNK